MSDRNVNINVNGKDNASAALGKVGKSTDLLSTGLGKLKLAFGALVGGAILNRAVGGLLDTAASMDEIGKASDRIGVATEALIGLKWAGEQAGVSFETLDRSLTKLNRNLSEIARGGAKPAADSLAEIGLNAQELFKLPFERQFDKIADGLNGVQNQADKTRIVMDLFGRAGADLLPLLAEGSEGLRQFREEAEKMGLIFTREDAAQMEQFNDQINMMNSSIGALKITLLGMAAPTVTAGAKIITDLVNGTDSVESRAFWAQLTGMDWAGDVRNSGSLKNDLSVGPYTPEQAAADAAKLGIKPLNDPGELAAGIEQLKTERAAKQAEFLASIGFGPGKKDDAYYKTQAGSEEAIKELPAMFEGAKAGIGSLFGSVAETGEGIGKSLVKGIEVGWDESRQRIKDRIDDLTEGLRTPIEVYRDGLEEVEALTARGLNKQTADRQRKALKEQYEATLPKLELSIAPQLQAREFRALTRAPGADSPELRAAKELQIHTRLAERQVSLLTDLLDETRQIADNTPLEANL